MEPHASFGMMYIRFVLEHKKKELNISHNTIKVLEKSIGRKISDIPRSNILTDTSPKARDIKERINKWDLIKIKSF